MDFTIYASELRALGVDPRKWSSLPQSQKQGYAGAILRARGNAQATAAAHLIESNNPNALQRLQLVWN